jgi:hypothetical protein
MFSLSDYSLTDDILNIQQVDMLEGMHFSNSFQSQWHIYSTFEEEKFIYMSDLVQNRHLIQNVVMQIGPNLCLQSAICNLQLLCDFPMYISGSMPKCLHYDIFCIFTSCIIKYSSVSKIRDQSQDVEALLRWS